MPNVALEASTDDLADFVLAQPTSAATRYALRQRRAAEALSEVER